MEILAHKFLLRKLGYKVIKNPYNHIEVYKDRTLIRCFVDPKSFMLWVKMLRKLGLV